MENPIQDLVETQWVSSNPRMPFEEQCAFHAALMCGVRNEAVAAASGLSLGAIAHLRHAGERHGGQTRYPRVARERANLGDDNFIHRYLTAKMRDRLAVAIDQVRLKKLEPKPIDGIRPHAKRYQGLHTVTAIDGSQWAFIVRLDSSGWLWGTTLEYGRPIALEHIRWIGDRSREGRGFPTSTAAYSDIINKLKPKG